MKVRKARGSASCCPTGDAVQEVSPLRDAKGSRDVAGLIGWGAMATVALVVLGATLGEYLGWFDRAVEQLPWWVPAAAIVLGGWRPFVGVLDDLRRLKISSHTLMFVGVIASVVVGEWATAALIVFFIRFADRLEGITEERSRQAIRELTAIQPATAHVLREGIEVEVPVADVAIGDIAVVRPGERIPIDGEIVEGEAPVNQAPITGESVPVDKREGDLVFAATVVDAGYLRVKATRIGADTTFARILQLVEEAEQHKAPVQRLADRVSAIYLPIVLMIALAVYFVTGNPLSAVAVLVVACACAIVIATPVVVIASVGSAARRGVLIKGGLTLENLAKVDTLVLDKTGTLTEGRPRLAEVMSFDGTSEAELLRAVASVESRSSHPIARAVVDAAETRGIQPTDPDSFESLTGRGLVATVSDQRWAIGNRSLLEERNAKLTPEMEARAHELESAGRTVFFAASGERVVGLVAVEDAPRPEAKEALEQLRLLGIERIVLLTGDNERVAAGVAAEFGVEYLAELLPEDKIAEVKRLQAQGAVVMMVGDGINDAPALVQANVGVAMGAAGTEAAMEAANVVLMRDDWQMIPEAIRIGRRSVRTIRQNLVFTAVYNVVGITLAATGLLPPMWAAAAQGIPDIAILLNSSKLLKR